MRKTASKSPQNTHLVEAVGKLIKLNDLVALQAEDQLRLEKIKHLFLERRSGDRMGHAERETAILVYSTSFLQRGLQNEPN